MQESVASYQPLALPRLSPIQAQLRNALLQHRPRLDIATPEGALSLGLVPASDGIDPAQAASATTDSAQNLMLAVGSAPMWLSLDAAPLERIAGVWSDAPAAEGLPPALQRALTTARFAPVLEALEASLGLDVRIIWSDAAAATEDLMSIGLVPLEPSSAPRCGTLSCDSQLARTLIDAVKRTASKPHIGDWGRLCVDLTLELGRAPFASAELAGLAPGDIVLLPSDAPIAAQQLVLRHGSRSLASARLDHNSITILRLAETSMTDDDKGDALDQEPDLGAKPPVDGTSLNPGDLEIRLDFDLGHLSLTLAELQRLQPGVVLELDTAAGRPVRIRAGRQFLGYGQLVQIEDRLGVIIRQLQVGDEPGTA